MGPRLKRAWSAVLDLIFPRRCASCRRSVGQQEPQGAVLCERCSRELPLIKGNVCRRCGLPLGPFATDNEGRSCESCRTTRLRFRRAVCYGLYEGSLRRAIGRFKYGGSVYLAKTFGGWLAERARESFMEPAEHEGGEAPEAASFAEATEPAVASLRRWAVVPVPLHPARRRQRTFDQASLLAREVAGRLGVPLLKKALERVVDTPTLTRMSRRQRFRTVEGAFSVARPELVSGRRILLVDDVVTTGATCSECARVLKASGAEEVLVAALARTP